MNQPAPRQRSPLFWVLLAGGGLLAMCCLASTAVLVLGAAGGDDSSAPAGLTAAAGGFSFTPPEKFKPDGPGRVKVQVQDNSTTNTVEVLRLAPIAGRDDAERKLQALWNDVIARDWDDVKPNPVVLRRFVSNGARAVFTSGVLRSKQGGLACVTVFLVDADDALVPLVTIQTSFDEINIARDMMASLTFGQSWALVEEALAGVQGSPVGGDIVTDDEVTGRWSYATGAQQQWVHAFTGRTGMDVVSYAIEYDFGDDHRYSYSFQGASGTVGALHFATDKAQGRWDVKHDVLTLTSDGGKKTEYLVAGAPRSPEGVRLLLLLPRPHWTLYPGAALANAELYSPR